MSKWPIEAKLVPTVWLKQPTFRTFFLSVTSLKFPIRTEFKIRPAKRASPVTSLIQRGEHSSLMFVKTTIGSDCGTGLKLFEKGCIYRRKQIEVV